MLTGPEYRWPVGRALVARVNGCEERACELKRKDSAPVGENFSIRRQILINKIYQTKPSNNFK